MSMTSTGGVNDGEVRVKGYPVWSRSTKKGHKWQPRRLFSKPREVRPRERSLQANQKKKKEKNEKMKMHREEQKK